MELFNSIGAALVLLLAILPALEFFNIKPFGDWKPRRGPWLWDLVRSELGAITVTYYARGGGVLINASTTAPTATQASQLQTQSAIVAFGATADAQARFTHNWGFDNSAPIYQQPQLEFYQTLGGTYMPSITFDISNTNVVLINKAATDAPATIVVTLRKGQGPYA